jgi:hypothetical protein
MAKRLVVKTGEYTNQQGETKGEYTKIGVILNNQNGEFVILDPSVNLAGVLIKQNSLAVKQGQQPRDGVMVSIFEDQQQGQQQGGQRQQNNQQGGYQQQGQQNPPQFEDSIPF